MHVSFYSALVGSGQHTITPLVPQQDPHCKGFRCFLETDLSYNGLFLPKNLSLEWDGSEFPSEFQTRSVAGVSMNGVHARAETDLCIAYSGYYWSLYLDTDTEISGHIISQGAKVEWLFGLEYPDCRERAFPFQIELPPDARFQEKYDALQLNANGSVTALRAAIDTEYDGVKLNKSKWLYLGPPVWISDRPTDPVMRYYDGSGGTEA